MPNKRLLLAPGFLVNFNWAGIGLLKTDQQSIFKYDTCQALVYHTDN